MNWWVAAVDQFGWLRTAVPYPSLEAADAVFKDKRIRWQFKLRGQEIRLVGVSSG
jgi:hypothetical protein